MEHKSTCMMVYNVESVNRRTDNTIIHCFNCTSSSDYSSCTLFYKSKLYSNNYFDSASTIPK
jgi:L-fucose isomerase-like protein